MSALAAVAALLAVAPLSGCGSLQPRDLRPGDEVRLLLAGNMRCDMVVATVDGDEVCSASQCVPISAIRAATLRFEAPLPLRIMAIAASALVVAAPVSLGTAAVAAAAGGAVVAKDTGDAPARPCRATNNGR